MTKKKKQIKAEAILNALNSDLENVVELRQLAISPGGLLNDELRRKAWPRILQVDYSLARKAKQGELKENKYYDQVVLDVNRSLSRFPPAMKSEQRLVLQEQLTRLIMRVLCSNPHLHYYQGYHDVCITFLLILGEELSYVIMNKLSNTHLREFMDPTMDRTRKLLDYVFPIVGKVKPELRAFLDRSEVGNIFCLSWLITWYGHVLDEPRHTVRLYDFFLACDPFMPIYMAAAIVLHREAEILSTECDMCAVHQLLSHLPNNLPLEDLISYAGDLYLQFPKENLLRQPPSLLRRLQQNYSLVNIDHLHTSSTPRVSMPLRRRGQLQPAEIALIAAAGQQQVALGQSTTLVKGTVWVLTAVMGVAAFAMQYIAREV